MAGKINKNSFEHIVYSCTSKEIDLMLYLCKTADDFGSCRDLYYKSICKELHISKQTFYTALYALAEKALIRIDFRYRSINVLIENNIFRSNKDYKKGYINLNYDFLYSREFQNSKLNIKRIALIVLNGYMTSKDKYIISVSKLCKKIKLLNKWVLNEYIEVIKKWFDVDVPIKKIGFMSGSKVLTFVKKRTAEIASKSIMDRFLENKILSMCRRYKVAYTAESLKDVLNLFRIYGQTKINKLIMALCTTIETYGSLEPKLLTHIINNAST